MLAIIKQRLRNWYETQISLPHGIAQFIGNAACLQLSALEQVDLNPCNPHLGTIRLTASDGRPTLTYKYWPVGEPYSKDLPTVQTIVELRRFQVRKLGEAEWELADINDPRVSPLKELFLAFAFYQPMNQSHKKPIEVKNG